MLVRIWSDEHRAYWRQGAHGYARERSAAGVFPEADARATTAHCGPEKEIVIEAADDLDNWSA